MKLSEFGTNEACEVLCTITPFLSNIVKDEKLLETAGKGIDITDMTAAGIIMAGVDRVTEILPLLLRSHRNDLFEILALTNRMTKEAIAEQPFSDTLRQIRETLSDEELGNFFSLLMPRAKTT